MSVTTEPTTVVTLTNTCFRFSRAGTDLGSRVSRDGEPEPRTDPSRAAASATGLRRRFTVDCRRTHVRRGRTDDGRLLADVEVTVALKPVAS